MGATTDPRAVLVGTTHFRDGQTTFYESRFIAGLRDPKGFVLLDEITRATDEANNILFPALDGQQYLSLDEAHPPSVVMKHPNMAFFATANIGAEYIGTRTLDRALKDRFCLVELDYPPQEEEEKILVAKTGIAKQLARSIVAFAHACRAQWRQDELSTPVSTRRLLDAAEAVQDGFSLYEALEYNVLTLFDATGGTDNERARVRQLLQRF
jgi:nitric oxide reductase NorQ protein